MSQEIYNKTVFKRFFEENDPKVLAWVENVLEKVKATGILPTFVNRGEDFESYWETVCHLFALIVLYSRQYNEIDTNKILFEIFIENRGLVTSEVTTLEQMQYLFDNYVDEYRKRGRLDIVSKEGVILGELLRLIEYKSQDEFIFSLLMSCDTGWTIGYSSPTWNRTDTVLNITKGYETTKSVQDLSKYPLINPTGISLVNDTDNEGNSIKVMSFVGDSLVGISSEVDKSKLLVVSENLAYQFSFKIKISGTGNQNLHFGVQTYDSTQTALSCIEAFTPSGSTPIESNNFIKNDGTLVIPNANIYYECRGTISKVNRTFAEEVPLNFLQGRGLKFQEGIKYISLELTQNRTANTPIVYIYDIKFKPIYLPFYQGYLGAKNVIASYYENNSPLSKNNIKEFTDKYLISYKNIFGVSEIFKNTLVNVRFKVFGDRNVYLQNATITVNGTILTTDLNGEVSLKLYPGDYLYSVEKEGFISIVNDLLSIYEQDEQIVYIHLYGELYERKITFVVKGEDNLPIQNAVVTFNGKFSNTGVDGTAVFYAYPGLYPYKIEKSKYETINNSVLVQDDTIEEVTLKIIPLYTLTFVVKNGDTPVEDAVVTINDKVAQTDSTGTAIITNLLGGTYTYNVEKIDWQPVSQTITVDQNRTINVSLEPVPTYTITFLVNNYNPTTETKIPLEGATVSYAGLVKTTGIDGTTSFIVKGGTYNYIVSNNGYVSQNGSLTATEDFTKVIDLQQTQNEVTIRVSAGGSYVANAVVVVGSQSKYTDNSGSATFNLVNGNYSYRVSYAEYYDATGDFIVNNNQQVIPVTLVQKTYLVTFVVKEDNNVISQGATVILNGVQKLTDSVGQAQFDVPLGTYSWSVTKQNYSPQSGIINMLGSPITRDINLIRKTSVITFVVTNDSGTTVSGASVIVGSQSGVTNANGRVSFTLSIGSYEYSVSKLPEFVEQTGNVTVTEVDQQINIILSNKVYNVYVTVKSPTGRVLSGVSVTFNGVSRTTDGNGQAIFSNFKNGTYNLSILTNGYDPYNSSVTVSNADKYVDANLSYYLISSSITVLRDGNNLVSQNVSIQLYDRNGDYHNTVTLQTDNYGKITYNAIYLGKGYVSINNSNCVAIENSELEYYYSNQNDKFYLWSALILTFNNSNSTPVIASGNAWDRNGNDVRIQGGSLNTTSPQTLAVSCTNMTNLLQIKQWPVSFAIQGQNNVFKGCTSLNSIKEGSPSIEGNVNGWFMNCTALRSIPSGLFLNMTGNSCTEAFRGCTSITSTSTGPLVNQNVVYHASMFRECTKLTTIGDSIFGKGGGTEDFHSVFQACSELTTVGGSEGSSWCFRRSTSIQSPDYAFASNPKLKTVGNIFSSAFTNLQDVTGIFSNCTTLTTYPNNLFMNGKITRMTLVFNGCQNIQSFPQIPLTCQYISSGFKGCSSLTDLSTQNIKLKNYTNLIAAASMFEESGISIIPSEFFSGCTSLTNVNRCFYNCKNLINILPVKQVDYDNNNKTILVTNILEGTGFDSISYSKLDCTSMFEGCTSLIVLQAGGYSSTEIAFVENTGRATFNANMNRMFYGCTALNKIPGELSTSPQNMFYNVTQTASQNNTHQNMFTGSGVASLVPSGWS